MSTRRPRRQSDEPTPARRRRPRGLEPATIPSIAFLALAFAAPGAILAPQLSAGEVVDTLRLDLLLKLLLAVVFGGLIGLEREIHGKPAGLRTNILICVGSALLMDLSINIGVQDGTRFGDPARLAAQVISGIGFLGAGTIMQARGAVIGLTTAATLWVVAAIGLTVGAGHYLEAAGAAALVGVVLSGLGAVEKRLLQTRRIVGATIRAARGTPFEEIDQVLTAIGIQVQSKQIFDHPEDRTFEVKLAARSRQIDLATSALMRRHDILSVQFD